MLLSLGQRVRFLGRDEPSDSEGGRCSIRPGEQWEGTVVGVDGDVVTVRVDLLNGMRTDGLKTLHMQDVDWK